MNSFSKITLSDDEQQLVANTEWILTKRKIIDKVDVLLGQVSAQQRAVIEKEKSWLPAAVLSSTPKIAKGENYLGLPYLLLDYPRCFNGDDIFAVRSMFWWGNFFSITLHLSGIYKAMFQENIRQHINPAIQHLFVCINESPWQHHFEADNYAPVSGMSREELWQLVEQKPFMKLAIPFPLQSWNEIPSLLENAFIELLGLLKY